eukprot:3322564-Amphidinium_carterae.1
MLALPLQLTPEQTFSVKDGKLFINGDEVGDFAVKGDSLADVFDALDLPIEDLENVPLKEMHGPSKKVAIPDK